VEDLPVPQLQDAAGVQTHYEDVGSGDVVAVLHGGIESGDDWKFLVDALAGDHRVVVPDRRGHGRTPDVAGPYTYPAMADETIAFLEQVAGGPTHLVGYSDGGIVALHVAIERPDLARSLVVIGTNFHVDGLHPQMVAMMTEPDPDAPQIADMRERHGQLSPDGPAAWPTVLAKVSQMAISGPTLSVEQLATITCPVLVVAADDDVVDLHHTAELFEAFPAARLAIVPGTSHVLPHERPDVLVGLVRDHLNGEPAPRMMPMRTAERS
jgi:pimeloyl-ACP methyl ester carboxylesterase